MSNETYRQYIGARYVPKFFENSSTGDNTWASGVPYEPLTIVTWSTIQYISKKSVPASVGAPNENLDYWVVNGTSSISSLTQRVNALENDVDEIDNTLDSLEDNKEVKLNKRRFLMLGDSYDNIASPVRWSGSVIDILGLQDTVVLAQGGYGFVTSTNKRWQDLVTNATIENEDTITDILIIGGANDAWATAGTIPTAIDNFDNYVRGRFTNLENIWLGFVGYSFYARIQVNEMMIAMKNYKAGAASCGWKYLTGIESTLYDPQLMQKIGTNDYIHPNTNGVRQIAFNAVQCLLTGSCKNEAYARGVAVTVTATAFTGNDFSITQSMDNGFITLSIGDVNFTASEQISGGGITVGTCADLTNMWVAGGFLPMTIVDKSDYSLHPAILYIDQDCKTLKMQVYVPIASGHVFGFTANTYVRPSFIAAATI